MPALTNGRLLQQAQTGSPAILSSASSELACPPGACITAVHGVSDQRLRAIGIGCSDGSTIRSAIMWDNVSTLLTTGADGSALDHDQLLFNFTCYPWGFDGLRQVPSGKSEGKVAPDTGVQ
jgi:hypothetical protein